MRRSAAILAGILPLLLLAGPAAALGRGDLDQSITTLRRKYGGEKSRTAIWAPGWHEVDFADGPLTLVCYVDPEENVRAITYYRTDRHLTLDEVDALRAANAGGSSWSKQPAGRTVQLRNAPAMPWQNDWRHAWRREDGDAVAVFDSDGWLFLRTAAWLRVLLPPSPSVTTRKIKFEL